VARDVGAEVVAAMGTEPWRKVSAGRPLSKMGHAQNHLVDFQGLDPSLTSDDVANILEYVRRFGTPSPGLHGGTLHRATVEIGGQQIPVLVVVSSAGIVKTGYPEV
jgi:hypothetical protein